MFDVNVAILAYSRSNHFHRVLKSCESNVNSVTVYMDYPKTENIFIEQEKMKDMITDSSCHVRLINRSENYGLVRSVLTSIKEELESQDHVILLEDDCVPTDGFFEFMSDSLTRYENDDTITSICATRTKCRFNPWGWATWKNKWKYESPPVDEVSGLPEDLLECLDKNDTDGIWSLGWLMTQYKNNCYSHFPNKNLIHNIGLDNSGVHSHEKGYTSWLLSQIMED